MAGFWATVRLSLKPVVWATGLRVEGLAGDCLESGRVWQRIHPLCARNRSAAVRIPLVQSAKARRIEVRFPDPTCNPYLGFTAMMMAGLDGVQNKINPGDPMDKNLYDLSKEEAKDIPHPCASLDEALSHLDKDRAFLTKGGVFTDDMIDAYIDLKMEEVTKFRMTTHPVEFDMYYSI
jgi:glutamine synthetase